MRAGPASPFPPQALYLRRDSELDQKMTEKAEAQLRQWSDEGRLPVPNSSLEQTRENKIDPPPGLQTGQLVDRTRDTL